ncbi:hypothetical protein VTN00DRAFT_9324 [Thermoascus crustaceus]|uniref:uncharacterized protein n=1 Tax=Thermoascus crustaceus TaxID=5088 RepID=UPI00374496E6
MASIFLPLQPQPSVISQQFTSSGSSVYRRKHFDVSMPAPPPNPPFVFPAREPDSKPTAVLEPESRSPPPLPPFSFNPGLGHASTTSTSAIPTHTRNVGHRRRCSELIGGDGHGIPAPMSSSQSGGENPLPAPASLPPPGLGLSAGGPSRRGHAHRRSAAVSSMDITAISKALAANPAAGSAPTTPAAMRQQHTVYDEIAKPMSRSATSLNRPTPPASPGRLTDEEPVPHASRFGDSLTVTPRPLSTISSETSSSLSTVRPDHSVTDSTGRKPRPKTADASLILQSGGNGPADGSQTKRPLSASGPSPSSRSASFSLKTKHSWSSDASRRASSSYESSDDGSSNHMSGEASGSSTSKSGKKGKSKKQKKMRSWAGAILTRGKGKKHSKKPVAQKTPTPPPILTRTDSDVGSLSEVNFDDDNIVIIRTPTNPNAPKPSLPSLQTNLPSTFENSWKPKSFYEQNTDNDLFSPVIDLDAALGPFNTPEMSSSRIAGSGFSIATKRMYSGGRRGEFIGPEMRYHRRAESAPEMPPFDRSFLNGSSVMANPDVFYEEEEDAFLAGNQSPKPGDEAGENAGLSSKSGDNAGDEFSSSDTARAATPKPTEGHPSSQDEGLGIQMNTSKAACPADFESDVASQQQAAKSQDNLAEQPFQPKGSVEIVQPDDWQSRSHGASSPDISPRCLPVDKGADDVAGNIPHLSLPPAPSLPNSNFSSPDPSGVSFEVPRSGTASTTTTDRNLFHPSYRDSTVEFPHGSVEDVPSLTSSASTMTNNMPRFSASFYLRPNGERAASYSAPVPRRTSASNAAKRSSLASLSRLVVGGSHGEKSKLSYEEKAPGDEVEKTKKKGHRISRLMHFWKTKEKEKHKENAEQSR